MRHVPAVGSVLDGSRAGRSSLGDTTLSQAPRASDATASADSPRRGALPTACSERKRMDQPRRVRGGLADVAAGEHAGRSDGNHEVPRQAVLDGGTEAGEIHAIGDERHVLTANVRAPERMLLCEGD